jgi:capsular exopolysaccharide synthesis family protein
MPKQEAHSIQKYIKLIRLNKIPILLFGLSGLIVAVIFALQTPNIYKSTAVFKVVKPQGSILSNPLSTEFQDFASDRFLANEIEILNSYKLRIKVAKALIDSFNVSKKFQDFSVIFYESSGFKTSGSGKVMSEAEVAGILPKKVTIEQKRGLDIIEVSAESPVPKEAALIANYYARAYTEENLSGNRLQYTTIKNFLAQQRQEKLNQLSNAEDVTKSFQEKKGIVELPEQAKALIAQSSDFQAKMNAAKIDLTISEKTLNNYKEELKSKNPDITNYIENLATEPYLRRLQEQIAELKTQRDRAMSSSAPNSVKVIKDAETKIDELKEKLNNSLSVYRAGILASSPEEIKELSKRVLEEEIKYQANLASFKKLNEIVGDYDKKMNQLPTSSVDLARLQREQSSNEKLYLLIEEKYQEAMINEQSVPSSVTIVDDALISPKPAKPNRFFFVIIGVVIGLIMGVSYAGLRDQFDNTIKTPEDIENKNINILSWIPEIEGLKAGNKEFEFIVAKKPDARASEAYRVLRTRIKFSKVGKDELKTILITSATSQEGKTTTAVNLAGSFARANFKTILLDTDLRKPRVHTVFNEKRFPGFSDYIFGQASYEDIVRKTELSNLEYITAGTIPPNPSEILGSSQMTSFLDRLKEEYDYIILDSPPIIAVTDAEIMSTYVDGSLLVVSASSTEIELMEKAVRMLTNEKGSFLGVLLNNFTYRNGYSSYYKHYYYYSSPNNGHDKNHVTEHRI